MMLWQKKRYEKKNSMFALIRSERPNIFGAKLRNPAQYPTQSSFCPAQFASSLRSSLFRFLSGKWEWQETRG